MKRLMSAFLALVMTAFVFTACQNGGGEETKSPVPADVMATIKKEISFPEMADKTVEDLPYFGYDGLDTSKVEDMAFMIATSGLTAEEVLIVKLKDDSVAADLKTMMETHRDQVAANAEGYAPEEMDKINSAVIETKGVYAFFAITGDNAKAKEIFKDNF